MGEGGRGGGSHSQMAKALKWLLPGAVKTTTKKTKTETEC